MTLPAYGVAVTETSFTRYGARTVRTTASLLPRVALTASERNGHCLLSPLSVDLRNVRD